MIRIHPYLIVVSSPDPCWWKLTRVSEVSPSVPEMNRHTSRTDTVRH
jgi:hypothetical protein